MFAKIMRQKGAAMLATSRPTIKRFMEVAQDENRITIA